MKTYVLFNVSQVGKQRDIKQWGSFYIARGYIKDISAICIIYHP